MIKSQDLRKNNLFVLVFLCAITVCFACWKYSFSGKTSLPGIETISIPLFTDHSNELQVRDKLQSLLISTFLDENIFKVVGQNQADAVLSGVIENISDEAASLTRQEEVRQWELRVTVQVKLENRKTGQIIMRERLTGLGFYKELVERDEAIDTALQQLTQDISNKIVSGW